MFQVLTLLMTITVLIIADGPVIQTGQIKSYDSNGDIVMDGSIKDDGYYQAGIVRSYTIDKVNEIIIDNAMGLQWQDNEIIQKPWITELSYNWGNYDSTFGDTATTYCADLRLSDVSTPYHTNQSNL